MRKVLHAVGDAAKYEVLCFPSFYRGGQAVKDLEVPQRVLLGAQDTPSAVIAQEAVTQLLSRWIRASPPLFCPHAPRVLWWSIWAWLPCCGEANLWPLALLPGSASCSAAAAGR